MRLIPLLCFLIAGSVYGNGEIQSPNMGLTIPAVGITTGPQWASDMNLSLGLIDAHDHSPGKGVPITPAGMNISSDLSCQSNNLTNIRASRFSPQGSPISAVSPDIGEIYVSGVDLYYNDGSGNQIRITQSGSVAGSSGTITGLPSGTASAAYSSGSGTFVFQQATSTAANMDEATIILRYPGSYPDPSGNYIAIQAPSSLATGYAMTLPATAPGTSGAFLTESTSGSISYTNVDNSTLQISSNILEIAPSGVTASQIAAGAVGTTQIANAAVTSAKLAATNYAISSSIGAASTTNSTPPGDALASVTLVTTGRPVECTLVPDGSGNPATLYNSLGSDVAQFYVTVDGTGVAQSEPVYGPGALSFTVLSAASHTIALRWWTEGSESYASYYKFLCYEIK